MRRLIPIPIPILVPVLLLALLAAGSTLVPQRPSGAPVPQAKLGVLDLRGWNASQDLLPLDGEWEWYPSRLLAPRDFSGDRPVPLPVHVPSVWSGYMVNGVPASNQGYATYRLQIVLPESLRHQVLALYVRSVATAYKLWIDGKVLAQNGTVGTSRQDMVPKNYPRVIYFQPDSERVQIVIQVSNFVQRKGGLWESIGFGTAGQAARERNIKLAEEAFTAGCLLIMTVYHLALYLARKRDRAALYFAAVSFLVGLRTLVLGETLAVYFFPSIPWELCVKAEYFSNTLGPFFLLLFIHSLYPGESRKEVPRTAGIIIAAYALLVLFSPARIYTQLFFYYQYGVCLPVVLYIFGVHILAVFRKRPGAAANCLGLAGLCPAIIHDTLFYGHILGTGDWVPFGFLFLLLTQSVQLSIRYSRAFRRVETLSAELAMLNESLEERIAARTADLRQANRELVRKEEFRRRLLSNISHELMTPLASLKMYLIGIMDKVVPADDPRHWQMLLEKAQFLEHMIVDLFELTKLETRQIRFHFRDVPLVPLMRDLFGKYELDIRNLGIHTGLLLSLPLEAEAERLYVHADPVRIEQIVSNLLSNAKKFTPPGGSITLHLDWRRDEGTAAIRVADTGPGIPEEEQEHVFERYYRGSNLVKSKGSGAGLGLAICREIALYHQGSIKVESKPGEGAAFTIELPARLKEGNRQKGEDVG